MSVCSVTPESIIWFEELLNSHSMTAKIFTKGQLALTFKYLILGITQCNAIAFFEMVNKTEHEKRKTAAKK